MNVLGSTFPCPTSSHRLPMSLTIMITPWMRTALVINYRLMTRQRFQSAFLRDVLAVSTVLDFCHRDLRGSFPVAQEMWWIYYVHTSNTPDPRKMGSIHFFLWSDVRLLLERKTGTSRRLVAPAVNCKLLRRIDPDRDVPCMRALGTWSIL